MRRVDRLLMKALEAQRLDSLQVGLALVFKVGDKWRARITLAKDESFKGQMDNLTIDRDTMEDAQAAVEELIDVHAPTGKYISAITPIIIVDDIEPDT